MSEHIKGKLQELSVTSKELSSYVKELVGFYTKELDDYLLFVRSIITDHSNPPTLEELEDFAITIPIHLYFLASTTEELGIKEDMAKQLKQLKYQQIYEEAEGTATIRKGEAERLTLDEATVHIICSRAYKQVKMRHDTALEVLNSVKKVITRRITELEVTKVAAPAARKRVN